MTIIKWTVAAETAVWGTLAMLTGNSPVIHLACAVSFGGTLLFALGYWGLVAPKR